MKQVFAIIADRAYVMNKVMLKPFLSDEATTANCRRLNHMLSGLQTVTIENIIGIWKQQFPALRMGF